MTLIRIFGFQPILAYYEMLNRIDGINLFTNSNLRNAHEWVINELIPAEARHSSINQSLFDFNKINRTYNFVNYSENVPSREIGIFSALGGIYNTNPTAMGATWLFEHHLSILLNNSFEPSFYFGTSNIMAITKYENNAQHPNLISEMPKVGFYLGRGLIVRDGYDDEGTLFSFETNFNYNQETGTCNWRHDENDNNSLTFFAFGRRWLIDCGQEASGVYDMEDNKSHNTILVDGQSLPLIDDTQQQVINWYDYHILNNCYYITSDITDAWTRRVHPDCNSSTDFSGAGCDVFYTSPFSSFERARRHTQFIQKDGVLPPYVIIYDDIVQENSTNRDYTFLLHTGPGNTVGTFDPTNKHVTVSSNNKLMDIYYYSTNSSGTFTNTNYPTDTDDSHNRLEYEVNAINPHFHVVLVPSNSLTTTITNFNFTNLNNQGSLATIDFSIDNFTDLSLFSYQKSLSSNGYILNGFAEPSYEGVSGVMAYCRKNNNNNEITDIFMSRGSYLEMDYQELISIGGRTARVILKDNEINIYKVWPQDNRYSYKIYGEGITDLKVYGTSQTYETFNDFNYVKSQDVIYNFKAEYDSLKQDSVKVSWTCDEQHDIKIYYWKQNEPNLIYNKSVSNKNPGYNSEYIQVEQGFLYTFRMEGRMITDSFINLTTEEDVNVPSELITIEIPNGNENWPIGSTQSIQWTSQNFNDNVKIEYSTNNGVNWVLIIDNTTNDGVYDWLIPNTPSTECKVKISDFSDGNPSDISDNSFEISDTTSGGVGTTFRKEAESMTLNGLITQNHVSASNGSLARVPWGGGSGTATYIFDGDPGTYELQIRYIDEYDGASTCRVDIKSNQVDTWVWNYATVDDTFLVRTIGTFDFSSGDEILVWLQLDGGEPARTDYLDFIAGGGGGTPPSAPSNLNAATVSSSQIDLTWTDNSSDESGFKIERKEGSSSYILVGTVGANVENYSDTGLSPSTTYTYRVYAYNGADNSGYSNEATATTDDQSGATSIEVRVANSSDDAEERQSDGLVTLTSTDLELTEEYGNPQEIGIRFTNITIPQGVTIEDAYVQFKVDETSSATTSLTIKGEASDNAVTFSASSYNISSRSSTSTSVNWNPPAWNTVGEAGLDQRTPDISAVIQAIVNRSGWTNGNALVLLITGSGDRITEAYDGDSAGAPLLHIEYSSGGGTPPSAPSNLNATTVSSSQIDLTWTDNSSDESGFGIERKEGSGSYILVSTVGANVENYSDTGLSPSTTYTYRVYAYNGAGNSGYSNEDSATTNSDPGGGVQELYNNPDNETAMADINGLVQDRRGTVSHSNARAHNGSYSTKFVGSGESGSHVVGHGQNNSTNGFNLNETYNISGWVYLESTNITVTLNVWDGSQLIQLDATNTSGGWIQLSGSHTMPSSSGEIKIEYYMSGNDLGIFYIDDVSAISQSSIPKQNNMVLFNNLVPIKQELLQNYPNPFNLETEIEYLIPEDSQIKLAIFNMKGELIRNLYQGYKIMGKYKVIWDGRDKLDNICPSGVYIYKLNVRNQVYSKKLLLVK